MLHNSAQRRFSNTDRRWKIEVIWKLRDRPIRLIRCGGSWSTRAPLSRISPDDSGKRPLTRLNSVVLPAPFGPMMAWRSPFAMSRLTPRMISVWPNALFTFAQAERDLGHAATPLRLQFDHQSFPRHAGTRAPRCAATRRRPSRPTVATDHGSAAMHVDLAAEQHQRLALRRANGQERGQFDQADKAQHHQKTGHDAP